jgi:MFS family permease
VSFLSSRSSRSLIREGLLDAAKMGASETYLGAFGVLLGGSPLQIGALATLPPLIGSIIQSIGMRLSEQAKSRRNLIALLMRIQALLLIPIASIPLMFSPGWGAVSALIAVVVVYHCTVGLIAPMWNSLVGDLLPPLSRGEFFGFRNKWMAIVTFTAIVIAGQVLHQFAAFGLAAWGFTTIFVLFAISRAISARAFCGVDDVALHVPEDSKFSFWQFIARAKQSNFVKFVVFVSSMNFAASVSGPFFAMYMLQDLKLSYFEYTVVVAAAVIAQFVVMRTWGSLSDQFGNRTILKVCGTLITFNPALWMISSNFWFVVFIQFYSGIFWAGFTLAAANFVFDAVTPPKRARCVAYQSIINGSLVFLGAIVGGFVARHVPDDIVSHLGLWVPHSPFIALFVLSGVLRAGVMLFLFPAFKEVRQVESIRSHQLLIRVTSLRPLWGGTFSYISNRYGERAGQRKKPRE